MIRFFNTLTREIEDFIPLKEGHVGLYTCGPTVYNTAHIGNFRTFLFEDLLKRFLIAVGYKVNHVMNITDVDDKTIKKAVAENRTLDDLTNDYADLFFEDMKFLKMLPADRYPRATGHIPEMVDMINTLLEKGHAYKTDDNSVYFNIGSFEDYGKLANIRLEEQRTSDRVQSDEYTKDNPQDFALWKSWKDADGDVKWDSPWGSGRPGWHLECSVMSTKYLGNTFDIHCGGVDNIFPHHENETAQSVCATGGPFVKYWLHSEHLLIDWSKMSKSAGNFYRLSDLRDMNCSAEMVRYILLSTHYRSKLNFSDEKIQEARKVIQRIADFKARIDALVVDDLSFDILNQEKHFLNALSNDLDSPKSLALFFDWLRQVNIRLDNNNFSHEDALSARHFLELFDSIFGFIAESSEVPGDILELVEQRELARKGRDWMLADSIRSDLHEKGWIVEDTPDGPKVKKI